MLDHRFVHNQIIYDNTYSRGKLSELQLLVRYEGDEPIWQEWSIQTKLNHVELVHEYLRTHKLAKFIPAQYKKNDIEIWISNRTIYIEEYVIHTVLLIWIITHFWKF